MERTRNALAYLRARSNANGPRPCDGVQDAQVWDLQQSALAIDATSRQSRKLSPRTDNYLAAATWRAANLDGPDALLSRTRDCGGRVVPGGFRFVEIIPTISLMKEAAPPARPGDRLLGTGP